MPGSSLSPAIAKSEIFPFATENPPCAISCDMHTIRWEKAHSMCRESPEGTLALTYERVNLIPYGRTILRMTEMPQIHQKKFYKPINGMFIGL